MASYHRLSKIPSALVACLIGALTIVGSAQASVISSTPTLPLLNTPYETTASVGCFPSAGVCITGGSLTLTSVDSSNFNGSGQDIVTEAAYNGTLTTLGNSLIGPVTLTGTVEQEVLGRTTSAETGSWTVDLSNLSLTGPVQGHTLTLTRTNGQSSDGTTSIVPLGVQEFSIDSFFDVFVTLSLDSPTPLHTTRGPIQLVAGPVPEPATIGLLGLPLLLLFALRQPNQAAAH
jgi:hypothetical protein